jgi:hypothetical protein
MKPEPGTINRQTLINHMQILSRTSLIGIRRGVSKRELNLQKTRGHYDKRID